MRSARYAMVSVLAVFVMLALVLASRRKDFLTHKKLREASLGASRLEGRELASLFSLDDTQLVDAEDIPADLKMFRPIRGMSSRRIMETDIYTLSAFVYDNVSDHQVHTYLLAPEEQLAKSKMFCVFTNHPLRINEVKVVPLMVQDHGYMRSYRLVCDRPSLFVTQVKIIICTSETNDLPENVVDKCPGNTIQLTQQINTDGYMARQNIIGLKGSCMTSNKWLKGLKGLPEVDELIIYDRDVVSYLKTHKPYKSQLLKIHFDLKQEWFLFKFTIANLLTYRKLKTHQANKALDSLVKADCVHRLRNLYGIVDIV